jgi:hypothetical protein
MTKQQVQSLKAGKTLKNPFYKQLTTPVSFRVPNDVLAYFSTVAESSKTETLEQLVSACLYQAMSQKLPEKIAKRADRMLGV